MHVSFSKWLNNCPSFWRGRAVECVQKHMKATD